MNDRTLRQVFVTGGAGFIGSYVVRLLVQVGVAVTALTRTPQPAQAGVTWLAGDLLAPSTWAAHLRGCDAVFHLAAAYSWQASAAEQLYAVNVGGTQAVLHAAADAAVPLVVHTSTIGVIGLPADGSLPTEDTPFNLWPSGSAYVRSKWLGDAAALWWAQRGLPVVIVHPTAPVGAGDHKPTATGQRFVDFLAGKRPDYPAGGLNLCPVQDMAAGHVLAAQRGAAGRRYILGHAAGNLSEDVFLQMLAEVSGQPIPPPVARRTGRAPQALTANPQRAIHELGMPQSDLRAAFAAAVAAIRAG